MYLDRVEKAGEHPIVLLGFVAGFRNHHTVDWKTTEKYDFPVNMNCKLLTGILNLLDDSKGECGSL